MLVNTLILFPFKLCTTRAWSVILHFYNYPNGITLLIVSQIMESMFPDDVLNKAKYKINIIFSLPSLPFPLPHSGWDSKYGQIRKLLFILKFHSYLSITLKFYFLHNYHNQQWCFYIWMLTLLPVPRKTTLDFQALVLALR